MQSMHLYLMCLQKCIVCRYVAKVRKLIHFSPVITSDQTTRLFNGRKILKQINARRLPRIGGTEFNVISQYKTFISEK